MEIFLIVGDFIYHSGLKLLLWYCKATWWRWGGCEQREHVHTHTYTPLSSFYWFYMLYFLIRFWLKEALCSLKKSSITKKSWVESKILHFSQVPKGCWSCWCEDHIWEPLPPDSSTQLRDTWIPKPVITVVREGAPLVTCLLFSFPHPSLCRTPTEEHHITRGLPEERAYSCQSQTQLAKCNPIH